jgi:hypothetical protein
LALLQGVVLGLPVDQVRLLEIHNPPEKVT